jgi:hypothetical protein
MNLKVSGLLSRYRIFSISNTSKKLEDMTKACLFYKQSLSVYRLLFYKQGSFHRIIGFWLNIFEARFHKNRS